MYRWMFLWLALLLPTAGWTACTPTQLNALLTADADGLGFAEMINTGNDAGILDAANLVRTGSIYQLMRDRVPSAEVAATFDDTEYAALTAVQLQKLSAMLAPGYVNFTKQNVRNILRDIFPNFPNGGPTRTALVSLATQQVSWAQLRCGALLKLDDISFALRQAR